MSSCLIGRVQLRAGQLPYLIEVGVPENDVKGIIVFNVSPPTDCLYFQHKSAMIPIIIKD